MLAKLAKKGEKKNLLQKSQQVFFKAVGFNVVNCVAVVLHDDSQPKAAVDKT